MKRGLFARRVTDFPRIAFDEGNRAILGLQAQGRPEREERRAGAEEVTT